MRLFFFFLKEARIIMANMPQIQYLLLLVINLCSVHATKYCSYELNGDPKYFVCARNEYCCNIGCCVHLAFQFYQLWYYWLLLIFMFMICSGGSWWYKFCRQTDAASHYPSIPLTIERSARHNFPELHGRRAASRAFDRTNSVHEPSSYHFHRIWKANNVTASPNYYTASIVRYHPSDIENRRQRYECPYYQLYGPPPSYESVVQLSASGNNSQASCVLLPTSVASSTQAVPPASSPSFETANVPASSSPIDPSLIPSQSTSANNQKGGTSSESSPESSPIKNAPSLQSLLSANAHSLQFSMQAHSSSTPDATRSNASKDQPTQAQTSLGSLRLKSHFQPHHLLHHPTIHGTDLTSSATIATCKSSYCSGNRFLVRAACTSQSIPSSLPPSSYVPAVSSSLSTAGTQISSASLNSPSSSHAAELSIVSTLPDPNSENGTRV